MNEFLLNLQLFGEGGDGGDGGSAVSAGDNEIDTSGEKIPASIPEKAKKYAKLLFCQALLIADISIENPSEYTDLFW